MIVHSEAPASEPDPADRRIFFVTAEEYDRLKAALAEPPKTLPRLASLLRESPPWDEAQP